MLWLYKLAINFTLAAPRPGFKQCFAVTVKFNGLPINVELTKMYPRP
jgi:hypothetical protein